MNIRSRLILSYLLVAIIPLLILVLIMDSSSSNGIDQLPLLNEPIYQIILVFLILILVILVSILNTNSLVMPVHSLQRAMHSVGLGNFKTKLNFQGSTELKKLSKSFNTMVSKLEETEKAKSEFLSITSHELKTPLTPIMANLELLQYEFLGPITEQQKDHISVIYRNTQRLKNLISDILDISRLQAGRMKFVYHRENLLEIIRRAIETVRVYANQKNISIVLNEADIPEAYVDAQRIQQVFINLIGNAIKFSPENSEIKITIAKTKEFLEASVSDDGIGMDEEALAKVFEPFYQADSSQSRRFGGSGLGLAICKEIVQAHQGEIWATSARGAGSAFHIKLPIKASFIVNDKEANSQAMINEQLNILGYSLEESVTLNTLQKKGIINADGSINQGMDLEQMHREGLIIAADDLFDRKILGKNNDNRNKYKKQA